MPLEVAPEEEVARTTTRVFCSWIEDLEDKDVGPQGDPVKEQCILCKYGGLNWIDPDNKIKNTVHPDKVLFQKMQGANSYELFTILDSYDDELEDSEQENKWEKWFFNVVDEIQEYYRKNPDDGVAMYLKGEIPSDNKGG